jgi:hypothetical protein
MSHPKLYEAYPLTLGMERLKKIVVSKLLSTLKCHTAENVSRSPMISLDIAIASPCALENNTF